MKQKTLLFTGMYPTADEIAFGRSVSAQFRNADLISEDDQAEEADYVAGRIPSQYEGHDVHPEWPEDGLDGFADGVAAAQAAKAQRGASGSASGGEKDSIPDEITLDWLKHAKKPLLEKLAKEEDVEGTDGLKVDDLRAALIKHFDLAAE